MNYFITNTNTEKKNVKDSIQEFICKHYPNPECSHVAKTGERFLKYLEEYVEGYKTDVSTILRSAMYEYIQTDIIETIEQRNIDFSSICAHHLLPFHGKICIKYIPEKYVVGLSKFPRICLVLSKRLNTQEELGNSIAKYIYSCLKPKYVHVTIEATHCCMSCRGIKNDATTITTHSIGNK